MNKLEIGGRNLVSIKDFAEIVGVQQSLLRHYDRIELFQPVLRDKNDYRFYSLQQIQTFKLIATLRSLRVSLEKIRELLAYRSPESMAKFLTKHEAVLHAELRALQENYLVIHSLRSAIQDASLRQHGEITIEFQPAENFSLGPRNTYNPEDYSYFNAWSTFYRNAHQTGINLNYSIGGYFEHFTDFLSTPAQPSFFFSTDPYGPQTKPAGYYLVAYINGGYGQMGDLPERLETFTTEYHLENLGPVFQVYIINEVSETQPENYMLRTCILIPDYKPKKY